MADGRVAIEFKMLTYYRVRSAVYAPLLNPIALVELIYSAKSRCEIPKFAGPSTIIDGL